ncbi:MAG: divalent-cation tolerance protein CutA [Candidatus Omnitrophica bacterium]|nr:divalent-cation tolerance protein CutA [Candidatus Omnitrophota bacterium]MBU4590531.1 divalent-cation tolerance protein CutA [Candidatus Omnitrophota bacterium]
MFIVVFITTANRGEAERVSKTLLDARLIACANIIKGVDSRFWWKGKKEKAREYLLIAKTRKTLFKKIVKAVRKEHSYDIPEIIAIPIIAGHKPYLDWIINSTRH